MDWVWVTLKVWLSWTFAPLIFIVLLLLLLGVVYLFFLGWVKVEDLIARVRQRFLKGKP